MLTYCLEQYLYQQYKLHWKHNNIEYKRPINVYEKHNLFWQTKVHQILQAGLHGVSRLP